MSFHPRQPAGAFVVVSLAALLSAASAAAQQSEDAPDAGAPPALSPEELEEIEKALGNDAAAFQGEPTAPSAPPSATTGERPLSLPAALGLSGLDLSFVLDVAAAAFTSKEPLQTGGHDPTRNGFNLQQLEMSIGSVVDPYLRFDSNLVFSQFGVEIEEAYVTTLALPASLQVRAGQFLTRFGRINPTHPHAWDFVDQPFAIGRVFGGEGNRGLGVELSWLTPLPWYAEVVGSATDAVGEATARSFLGASNERVLSPLDLQLTGALKQFFPLSDDLSLLWGLSAASGPNPTGYRNRTDVFGTDVYLRYRPLRGGGHTFVTLQVEALYRRRQVPDDVLTDLSGYAQATWRFSKRWATAVRYELGTPARNEDGRVVNDPLDPEWTEDRQRISANVTFWPTEFSRLRLQGATDRVGWRESPDTSVFLALEVLMGAHGAHVF